MSGTDSKTNLIIYYCKTFRVAKIEVHVHNPLLILSISGCKDKKYVFVETRYNK